MTCKLEPWVEKIISPITLILPDGDRQEYENGASVVDTVFNHRYIISTVCAVDSKIQINLREPTSPDESFF